MTQKLVMADAQLRANRISSFFSDISFYNRLNERAENVADEYPILRASNLAIFINAELCNKHGVFIKLC
jgi:hypothetical protein